MAYFQGRAVSFREGIPSKIGEQFGASVPGFNQHILSSNVSMDPHFVPGREDGYFFPGTLRVSRFVFF